MPKNNSLFSSSTLLALAVGVFLLLSGVQTLIDFNSPLAKAARGLGGMFGADQSANVIIIVVAILKIVSGAVLAIGPFGLLNKGIQTLAFFVVAGFWAVFTAWSSYQGGVQIGANQVTVMQFLQGVSLNLAILAAIWKLKPEGK